MNRPQVMIDTHSRVDTTANTLAAEGRDSSPSHAAAWRRTALVYTAVIAATITIIAILAQKAGVTNCRTGSAMV